MIPNLFRGAPLRTSLVGLTFIVFVWYFAVSSGENIQRMTWTALPFAAWWTCGVVSVLVVCRPPAMALFLWAIALGLSVKALADIYASTSSTAGIGLLLDPLLAGSAGLTASILVNWMARSPGSDSPGGLA